MFYRTLSWNSGRGYSIIIINFVKMLQGSNKNETNMQRQEVWTLSRHRT